MHLADIFLPSSKAGRCCCEPKEQTAASDHLHEEWHRRSVEESQFCAAAVTEIILSFAEAASFLSAAAANSAAAAELHSGPALEPEPLPRLRLWPADVG